MRRLLLAILLVGCVPAPTPGADGSAWIQVEVVAGPVCPVEQQPPGPNCAPRPVAGVRLFVQPGDGRDILVAEGTTDEDGRAIIEIEAGDYIVVGGEVDGLMGRPEPATVSVSGGQTATVALVYDTGIR